MTHTTRETGRSSSVVVDCLLRGWYHRLFFLFDTPFLPRQPLGVTSAATAAESIDSTGVFKLGRNMPPGDYVLQVIVRDLQASGKGALATQWTDFEISN